MQNAISEAMNLLATLVPRGLPLFVREPLTEDESRWLVEGVRSGLFRFRECGPKCPRFIKRGTIGPDEFVTPAGVLRHMFSSPEKDGPALNREYIPHLAAYARAVLDFGYDPKRSSLSLYRKFTQDLITKRRGTSYETDAEFYDGYGNIFLHVEAKKDARQVARIAAQLDAAGELEELPTSTVKEIEYVLDVKPRFLWLVGPDSIDPARFVYAVTVTGMNARFDAVPDVPRPPGA